MRTANVYQTDDLHYKGGFVECRCGWRKDLGDGFDGYHIDNCPHCTPELETRRQDTVTVGKPGAYEIRHGSYTYFVLSNGIHVQYHGITFSVDYRQRLPRDW